MSAAHTSDTAKKAVLELKNVTKTFGKFTAVDGLDFAIKKGEIFGFLGPNGAGKSTTIRMILDATRPSSGDIELFGTSSRHTAQVHQKIGYLSGDMVLDDDLTGRQYLDFVASLYQGNQKELADYRHHLAYELELEVDTKISRYSRGNKQKVGLVAALMHNPELLILDEPSSGLDPLMQEVFIRLIQEYRRDGGTVFMSSHSLAEVQKLCDRVAFIRAGKLAGVADIDELNRTAIKQVRLSADREVIAHIVEAAPALSGLTVAEVQGKNLHLRYKGPVRALLQLLAQYELDDVTIREPELDEIFMTYYQSADRPPEEATS